MHIAFITPEFPHPKVLRAAGIGTSINNLIQGIKAHSEQASKIRFSLFVYGQKENAVIQEREYALHLIAHKTYRLGGFIRYRMYLNAYIEKVVKAQNIDVLEAPDWTGITAYMRFTVPLIIRLHGTDTYFCDLEGRDQKKKNFHFEKKALQAADAITAVSRFTAERTQSLFDLKTSVEVIHNSIDTQFFKPSTQSIKGSTILYFGSVIRKKGVLELARAFNKVIAKEPKAQLIFLGKDVIDIREGVSTIQLLRGFLDQEAKQSVKHIAQVPYQQVKEYINEAAVICLPSHAEAFPMTWLEAMAMQKPMVTSNVGWAPEVMIDQKTGLMVDPNDIDAIAQALLRLLTNRREAQLFGKNAREHLIANFDHQHIARQNLVFYKNTVRR